MEYRTVFLFTLISLILTGFAGCGPGREGEDPDSAGPGRIRFKDVTAETGILFRHESGARGKVFNPETFGPGGGWLDHDGDGLPDLLLVNGNLLDSNPDDSIRPVLYRNIGKGRFEDVSSRLGLSRAFYAMGFSAADVDNDGDQDVLIYGLHQSAFLLNDGSGRFTDTSAASGLGGLGGWVCAAAFFDYDRDGKLDLFVGNYVDWKPGYEAGLECDFGTARKKYCPVAMFKATSPQLFRGDGRGGFREVTKEAGLDSLLGKALGVAVEDYNRDGWPDLLVANDSVPNFLLLNGQDGTFSDRGIDSGFATDGTGASLAGMGIDTAWTFTGGPGGGEAGGRLVVGIGNFSDEPTTIHVQEDRDYFVERSIGLGVGRQSMPRVTFGLAFCDLDLDGEQDLVTANGHVFDVESISGASYRQPLQIFRGLPGGGFRELPAAADPSSVLGRRIIGRALAHADFDGDGDQDFLVTENQGGVILLRNDSAGQGRYLRISLQGTESNRDAIGAEVTLYSATARTTRIRRMTVKSSLSYLSQCDRRLVFGLPADEKPRRLEIRWPRGRLEQLSAVPPEGELLLVEGEAPAAQAAVPAAPPEPSAPANSIVLRNRGTSLLESGRPDESLKELRSALRLDPHDFVAWRAVLLALKKLGRQEELQQAVSEIATTFGAGLVVSHFAIVLRESGHRALAERLFDSAAKLAPGRSDVWSSLGNLAYDRGDFERARSCYEKVIKLHPGSVEALDNLGKISAARGEYERAVSFLSRGLELSPASPSILSTLGGVELKLGKLEDARGHLEAGLKGARSDATRLNLHGNLGGLYIKLRDWDEAEESFLQVLELSPGDAQALRALEYIRRQRN